MKVKEFLLKIPRIRLVLIMVAALLVVAITVTAVLVFMPADDDYIKPPDDTPIEYSTAAKNKFLRNLHEYIKQFVPILSVNKIGNSILTAFSKARISEAKLTKLSDLLSNTKIDFDKYMATWVICNEDGEPIRNSEGKYTLRPEITAYTLGEEMLKIFPAIEDFLLSADFTEEEIAKVFFYILYDNTDETYRAVLDSLGRGDFVTLFIGTVTVYSALDKAIASGGTLNEARMLHESLYETGASYERIFNALGAEGINTLLGLNTVVDDKLGTDSTAILLNHVTAEGAKISYFAANALAVTMQATNAAGFEAFFRYKDATTIDRAAESQLIYFALSLAQAIDKGINDSVADGLGTEANFIDHAAAILAKVYLMRNGDGDYQAEYAATLVQLTEYFAKIHTFAAKRYQSPSIIAALDTAEYNELKAFSDYFLSVDEEVADGLYALGVIAAFGMLQALLTSYTDLAGGHI